MNEIERIHPADPPTTRQGDVVSSEARQVKSEASTWAGPLPPPGALRSFEEVIPGSAERILAMAEQQMDHRILMERKIVSGDYTQSYLGIAAGFLLSVTVILGGIYLITQGHDWAGGILIGIDLVGLAGVFVYGSRSHRAQRRERHDTLAEKADLKPENQRLQDPN